MTIRDMNIADYHAMTALWRETPGVRLVEADSEPCVASFLLRNPGMSFVCESEGVLIGTAMCGHDGRRGYVYHVAVRPEHRGKRIGTRLVEACLAALRGEGIDKCHVFVLAGNELGKAFWSNGWGRRDDIALFSRDV